MKFFLYLFSLCCFNTYVFSQATPIYHNSFDYSSDTIGWSHYALSGRDFWERGAPNKPIFDSVAKSAPYCWVTDTAYTGILIGNSALETPSFNLSDTTKKFGVKFFHKRQSNSTTTKYYFEYSLNNGMSWSLLYDNFSLQKGWQNSSGFSANSYSAFQESAFSLISLVGESNVKFRFRYETTNHGEGWLIDDFTLFHEEIDINLITNNTIVNRAQTCQVNLTLTNYFDKTIYFNQNKTFDIQYYLSLDTLIDTADLVLYNRSLSMLFNNGQASFSDNLTLPNLNRGTYYVITSIDNSNQIKERDETNNTNFISVKIDSVFNIPYVNNFDENVNKGEWKNNPLGNNWKKGSGTHPQISGTHSGDSAWFSVYTTPPFTYLTTPYFNLSSDTGDLYISFWYKDAESTGNNYAGGVSVSTACNGYLQYPSANIYAPITQNTKQWKYLNHSLNSYSTQQNMTFYFSTGGYNKQLIIDDIYIGHAKPDLSIEDDSFYERFIPKNRTVDTLVYKVFNSGKKSTTVSNISFYFSADSLFDSLDILLGNQNLPGLYEESDTVLKFIYNVPSVSGRYFIFYNIDTNELIDEMREYNNLGMFTINKNEVFTLPYFNDFESSVLGWSHSKSLGNDDWQWTTAKGSFLNPIFAPTKGWITKDTGIISSLSRMHLYSPIFDFSGTINPSIEFKMLLDDVAMNMSYTLDGGATWLNVKKTNGSYSKWYYGYGYDAYSGTDRVGGGGSSELFFEDFENFFKNYGSYNSRNNYNASVYNIGLPNLAGEKTVQFRFNLSGSSSEGAFIDNFSIKNGLPDLQVDYKKNLLLSPSQVNTHIEMKILNYGNYMSKETDVKFYLSVDTVLDATDYFTGVSNIDSIQPKMYGYLNQKVVFPNNLGSYKYLLYSIDEANIIHELDEINNVGYWLLGTDSIIDFPYYQNFNDTNFDGWTTYTYSKYNVQLVNQWRWRNMTMLGEPLYFTGTQSKEMFTDRINVTLSETGVPYIYLQTPAFDFSSVDSIIIEFDFLAVGGGNMEYSLDGGGSWTLFNPQGTYGNNWYNSNNVYMINQPGWKYSTSSNTPSFYHCIKDISPLKGEGNVILRFKQRGVHGGDGLSSYGMKIDNFMINVYKADYQTNDSIRSINTALGQNSISVKYNIKNLLSSQGKPSVTNFYWSKDSIIDSNDQLIYSKNEVGIAPLQEITDSVIINLPSPIDSTVYYLLYKIDGDNNVVEVNENNNYGGYKVSFPQFLNYYFPNSILYDSIFSINNQDSIDVNYTIINEGNINGDSSQTRFYWSLDNVFDIADTLIGEELESPIGKNDTINKSLRLHSPQQLNSQSIYYLVIEIDEKDSISETNEFDNIAIIPIHMDFVSIKKLSNSNINGYYSEKMIHINFKDNFEEEISFSVFSSIGQRIINMKLPTSFNTIKIPFEKYSKGVYYIVFTANNTSYTKKIIAY